MFLINIEPRVHELVIIETGLIYARLKHEVKENIIQNQKHMRINNIKLIYLTSVHCTTKQITELN